MKDDRKGIFRSETLCRDFFPLSTLLQKHQNTKKKRYSASPKTDKNLSAPQALKEKFINGFHRNQSAAYTETCIVYVPVKTQKCLQTKYTDIKFGDKIVLDYTYH